MTGVGSNGAVARPEVVIEGSHDGAEWFEIDFKHKPGKLMFYVYICKRCTPVYPVRARRFDSHTTNMRIVTITCVLFCDLHVAGNLATMPTIVAPHQPRLDWQMWFAALQGYVQNMVK